ASVLRRPHRRRRQGLVRRLRYRAAAGPASAGSDGRCRARRGSRSREPRDGGAGDAGRGSAVAAGLRGVAGGGRWLARTQVLVVAGRGLVRSGARRLASYARIRLLRVFRCSALSGLAITGITFGGRALRGLTF